MSKIQIPATPHKPDEKPLQPMPPQFKEGAAPQDHARNVGSLLEKFETEFRDVASNPHAPADRVAELLNAIHALRLEKTHTNPNPSRS